jgi:hypothetical protein
MTHPRTSISTPALTSATTAFLCSEMPGVVCSAIASHHFDRRLRHPILSEKVARRIRAIHLETQH